MVKFRRIMAVILAVSVLLAMTASFFIMAHNAGHNCTGEHCHVCEITNICLHTLKTLRSLLVSVLVACVCLYRLTSFLLFPVIPTHIETPISLKVKLLN